MILLCRCSSVLGITLSFMYKTKSTTKFNGTQVDSNVFETVVKNDILNIHISEE